MKMTSAQAAKLLRQWNESLKALQRREENTKTFLASLGEDLESVRPEYDRRQGLSLDLHRRRLCGALSDRVRGLGHRRRVQRPHGLPQHHRPAGPVRRGGQGDERLLPAAQEAVTPSHKSAASPASADAGDFHLRALRGRPRRPSPTARRRNLFVGAGLVPAHPKAAAMLWEGAETLLYGEMP